MYKYIGIYMHNIYLVKDTRLRKEKYRAEEKILTMHISKMN